MSAVVGKVVNTIGLNTGGNAGVNAVFNAGVRTAARSGVDAALPVAAAVITPSGPLADDRRGPRAQRPGRLRAERGVAAVEFALVSVVFFTIFLGIVEMGWLLFQWNTTAEATRMGARHAVVCSIADKAVLQQKVRGLLGTLSNNSEVQIDPLPAGCTESTCEGIRVRISAASNLPTFNPFVPNALRLPASTTTLMRESMASTLEGGANPMCQ